MKKKRAKGSVGNFRYERGRSARALTNRGFSVMILAAAVSVLAFLAVLGWRLDTAGTMAATAAVQPAEDDVGAPGAPSLQAPLPASYALTGDDGGDSSSATSSDTTSQFDETITDNLLNAYASLKSAGIYSTSTADATAENMLPLMQTSVSYKTFTSSDIKTDSDTSYARMLTYRSDLRAALAPLLKDTTPEYEIFGDYVQTGDTQYLTELEQVVQNYHDAADASANVIVPVDAVPYHIAILNAMEEFAAVLDALGAHANDPLESVALLHTYDQAEADMLTSFNALATYYKSKQP